MKKFQQGDVILKSVNSIPVGGTLKKDLILAEGERTGHTHKIVSGQVQLILLQAAMYLRVISETAKLIHNEHEEISIPEGDYEVTIVREFDPFEEEIRTVQD